MKTLGDDGIVKCEKLRPGVEYCSGMLSDKKDKVFENETIEVRS